MGDSYQACLSLYDVVGLACKEADPCCTSPPNVSTNANNNTNRGTIDSFVRRWRSVRKADAGQSLQT